MKSRNILPLQRFAAGAVLVAALFAPAYGQLPLSGPLAHHEVANPGARPLQFAHGEIRKVDKDTRKLTIEHGPVPGLGMPATTTIFEVRYPAMLEYVKAGDRVRFAAEKAGRAVTVTAIEQLR